MIIKSLSRKASTVMMGGASGGSDSRRAKFSTPFGKLIRYMNRGIEDGEGRAVLWHNFYGGDRTPEDQLLREFEGNAELLQARKNGNVLYHEILSFSAGHQAPVAAAAAAALRPRAAVAFYPGCAADLQQGHAASAPLLLLLGADDDWTPAAPCLALVDAAVAGAAGADIPKPQVVVYPGAYHGFDGTAPVQLRRDVPNGARPGAGVHVGGQPEARVAAHAQLLGFLRQALR